MNIKVNAASRYDGQIDIVMKVNKQIKSKIPKYFHAKLSEIWTDFFFFGLLDKLTK